MASLAEPAAQRGQDELPSGSAAETVGGELISRRDAAILAGCSEDTIKRDIRVHGLSTSTGPGGCVMVAIADLVQIGRVKPSELAVSGHGGQSAQVRRAEQESARLTSENGRLTGAADARAEHLQSLAGQLKEKDKQISELHKTVERVLALVRTASVLPV